VPSVPAAGVPLKAFVAGLNVTPLGSAPLSLTVGAGIPVAVTVKEPARPSVKAVLLALVIAGGWVGENLATKAALKGPNLSLPSLKVVWNAPGVTGKLGEFVWPAT
jgi:hypothetical protein